jgi:hypothetical protein
MVEEGVEKLDITSRHGSDLHTKVKQPYTRYEGMDEGDDRSVGGAHGREGDLYRKGEFGCPCTTIDRLQDDLLYFLSRGIPQIHIKFSPKTGDTASGSIPLS